MSARPRAFLESPMPKPDSIDRDRRAVLAVGGALILGATLWPANPRAQTNSGSKMPIGTIGAGHIGSTIGGLWINDGHKVFFSSRHPEELKDLVAKLGPLAQAGPVDQAIAIADEVEANGIGVTSQKYLPGTRLVRAFNTMSYAVFAREANRPDPKLAVPIAGDDPEAVRVATGLVRDAGFDPVVVGKLVDAKLFQRGGPGYGQQVTAAELKQKLSLPQ
jgi:8-hydroxy-5-deazaflavin:NADPH oxidoreductase